MASVVDICNGALTKLGGKAINSLDDGTKSANACKLRYDIVRKAVLRLHIWKSCKRRATLNPETSTPAFEWDFEYKLPPDVLRLFLIVDDNYDQIREYEKEGMKVLTDCGDSINIKYIADVEDTEEFDDLLVEAISLYLAVDIAYQITQDENRVTQLRSLMTDTLLKGKSVDAKEDFPKTINANTWVNDSRSSFPINKYPQLQ